MDREGAERLRKLQGMANRVRQELGMRFRFRPEEEVISYIDDVSLEEGAKAFGRTARLRGYSEQQFEREIQYMGKWNACTCMYTGDFSPADYSVFVRGMKDVTPVLLGQAIAQGEHMAEHVRRTGSLGKFRSRFSDASVELIGCLGFDIIGQKEALEGNEAHADVMLLGPEDPQLEGYGFADMLVHSRKEVPYSRIFHAENEHEMWLIVKGITGY